MLSSNTAQALDVYLQRCKSHLVLMLQITGRNTNAALEECGSGTDPCLLASHVEKCVMNMASGCIALIPLSLDRPDLTFKPSLYML